MVVWWLHSESQGTLGGFVDSQGCFVTGFLMLTRKMLTGEPAVAAREGH